MLILPYLPCKFAQPAVVTNKNNLLRGIFLPAGGPDRLGLRGKLCVTILVKTFSLLRVITMICAFSNTFENVAKCMDFNLFSGGEGKAKGNLYYQL